MEPGVFKYNPIYGVDPEVLRGNPKDMEWNLQHLRIILDIEWNLEYLKVILDMEWNLEYLKELRTMYVLNFISYQTLML